MLRFGTAGLRGPLRAGPDGMNADTVARATAGVVAWLRERCLRGGRVVVGRDARHGSAEFATVTAEIFQAGISRLNAAAAQHELTAAQQQEDRQFLWWYGLLFMVVSLAAEGIIGRRLG